MRRSAAHAAAAPAASSMPLRVKETKVGIERPRSSSNSTTYESVGDSAHRISGPRSGISISGC